MAKFRTTTTAPATWSGGPPVTCASCKFVNHQSKYFLVFEDVWAEQGYDLPSGKVDASGPVVLCSLCVEKDLAPVVQTVAADDRIPALQAKLLQAEAARAKAEKRADLAEKAISAMQDWIAGDDEDNR